MSGPGAVECITSVLVIGKALWQHLVVQVLLAVGLVMQVNVIVGLSGVLNVFHEVVVVLVALTIVRVVSTIQRVVIVIRVIRCYFLGVDAVRKTKVKLDVGLGWHLLVRHYQRGELVLACRLVRC